MFGGKMVHKKYPDLARRAGSLGGKARAARHPLTSSQAKHMARQKALRAENADLFQESIEEVLRKHGLEVPQ